MQKKHLSEDIPKFQTSHAILLVSDKYVLQLRDNIPTISAAGQWSLFGGMKNDNETPLQAINREVLEELSVKPGGYKFLWFTDYYSDFERAMIRTYFFVVDVTAVWHEHRLTEGQAVGVFKFEQLADLDVASVMREAIEKYHTQTVRNDAL
jgi:ADP-ribose pyrophosphatase YjhB (NUDIX family)